MSLTELSVLPMGAQIGCLKSCISLTSATLANFVLCWSRVSFRGGRGGIRPPLKTFCPPLENSKFQF